MFIEATDQNIYIDVIRLYSYFYVYDLFLFAQSDFSKN